jgi:predicted nucleic acid-binding protein
MLMPDVNVLVYAHRQDEAWHAEYAAWLPHSGGHGALAPEVLADRSGFG